MKNKLIDIFFDLVAIDSVSGEESLVSKYLIERLKKVGIVFKSDRVGNIYWRGSLKSGSVLYCAHMDTVEPGRGIRPRIDDGYIKSSGDTILGADNKAYVAALVCAIEDYFDKYKELPGIELIFSVKEETGGGMDNFSFDWLKSKKAYLFDYGKPLGRIIIAAPYIYNFKIVFRGKAAHASRPAEGINALNAAIYFLGKWPVGSMDGGKTTINVGMIRGGSGINTIPDEVVVEGEIRSTDKNKFDYWMKRLEIIGKKTKVTKKAELDITCDGFCPGYEYQKDIPEILELKGLLNKFGIEPQFDKSTGVSDANPLSEKGIVAINLSDGVEGAHTKEEKIAIDNLNRLKDIVLRSFEDQR